MRPPGERRLGKGPARPLPLAPNPMGAPFRRCAPAPLGGEPLDVTRRRKMKMAVYMAMDGEGKRVNLVEIEEGQVLQKKKMWLEMKGKGN